MPSTHPTSSAISLLVLLACATTLPSRRGDAAPCRFGDIVETSRRPGPANASRTDTAVNLENRILALTLTATNGSPCELRFVDKASGESVGIPVDDIFRVAADSVSATKPPHRLARPSPQVIAADPGAARLAATRPGYEWTARLADADAQGRDVDLRAELRDGAHYVRLTVTIRPGAAPLPVKRVTLLDTALPGARVRGAVDGSPVTRGPFFIAVEHPMAKAVARAGHMSFTLERSNPLPADAEWTVGFVLGVKTPGQERRDFQVYVERERVHPYRPFLHYNSWYDIAWPGHRMNEQQCVGIIRAFGKALITERDVPMASFVFDDGWDDFHTLWGFHDGFPHGFTPLAREAATLGAGIGTWVSPWGGYGQPKAERVKYGRAQGYETDGGGLSLAGPRYNRRFTDICLNFMNEYDCNFFKFDGIGGGTLASGAPRERAGDLEALLALGDRLHTRRPNLFISATVGTWPSPFWLWSVDSVWRQGEDIAFAGPWGTMRDKWITYRDGTMHARIVERAPFYPVNSLMLHGIAFAQLGTPTRMNNDVDAFTREVRSFFASGTGLQELYISHNLMTPAHWDILAETARWANARAQVLADTHWLGGNPLAGDVYGYAAWSPPRATLMLRNPTDQPQSYPLELGAALQLPDGAPATWTLTRPWTNEAAASPLTASAGQPLTISLAPLQVAVYDATPVADGKTYQYAGYEEAARAYPARPEEFVGRWQYPYQGNTYCREFRADGTAMLLIDGTPYSGWKGFKWEADDGRLYLYRPDGTLDGEHELKDRDTLIFVNDPFGPARRVGAAQPESRP